MYELDEIFATLFANQTYADIYEQVFDSLNTNTNDNNIYFPIRNDDFL